MQRFWICPEVRLHSLIQKEVLKVSWLQLIAIKLCSHHRKHWHQVCATSHLSWRQPSLSWSNGGHTSQAFASKAICTFCLSRPLWKPADLQQKFCCWSECSKQNHKCAITGKKSNRIRVKRMTCTDSEVFCQKQPPGNSKTEEWVVDIQTRRPALTPVPSQHSDSSEDPAFLAPRKRRVVVITKSIPFPEHPTGPQTYFQPERKKQPDNRKKKSRTFDKDFQRLETLVYIKWPLSTER